MQKKCKLIQKAPETLCKSRHAQGETFLTAPNPRWWPEHWAAWSHCKTCFPHKTITSHISSPVNRRLCVTAFQCSQMSFTVAALHKLRKLHVLSFFILSGAQWCILTQFTHNSFTDGPTKYHMDSKWALWHHKDKSCHLSVEQYLLSNQ